MKYKLFPKTPCPNCNQPLDYTKKLSLLDYRFPKKCKYCGCQIGLPIWHSALFIAENMVFFALACFIIRNVAILIAIWLVFVALVTFIQVRFAPIVKK